MSLTEQQKTRRLLGIGGSDISALVGCNPFARPIDVYAAKVEGREIEDNFNLERGRFFELPTAEWRCHRHGGKLIAVDTVQDEKHPVIIVHPDFCVEQDGETLDLSIKSPGPWAHEWGASDTDEVPPHALVQLQYELVALRKFGITRGEVAAVVDGDLRVYPISADEELQSMLIDAAERFWTDHVLRKVPPAPDASENYGRWLKHKHPAGNGELRTAEAATEQWARALRDARIKLSTAEAEAAEAKNNLIAFIGDADGIQGSDWKILFRSTKGRETTDWRAVCMEAQVPPSLVKQHTKRTPFRTFRPSGALFQGAKDE